MRFRLQAVAATVAVLGGGCSDDGRQRDLATSDSDWGVFTPTTSGSAMPADSTSGSQADEDSTSGGPEDSDDDGLPPDPADLPGTQPNPNPQCEGLARVIYMDDGGVPNDDPNGVQDLAIVLGWEERVELIAIGSTSWNPGSAAFLQSIVDEAGSTVPVLTEDAFINTIIAEARAMEVCDGKQLNVAIGGEWFKLATALQTAPDIAPWLHVAGIAGWNIRTASTPEGIPRDAYDTIVAHVGEQNIFRIDDKNDRAPHLPDFRDAYEVEPGYSVADLDGFYDNHLRPLLQQIPDPSDGALTISDESSFYISHTRLLNHGQGEGDGVNASKLRIADFLTLAHVIWRDDPTFDIFDKDQVYPEIAAGLATLP